MVLKKTNQLIGKATYPEGHKGSEVVQLEQGRRASAPRLEIWAPHLGQWAHPAPVPRRAWGDIRSSIVGASRANMGQRLKKYMSSQVNLLRGQSHPLLCSFRTIIHRKTYRPGAAFYSRMSTEFLSIVMNQRSSARYVLTADLQFESLTYTMHDVIPIYV